MRRGPAVFLFVLVLAAVGYGAGWVWNLGSDQLSSVTLSHMHATKPTAGSPPLAQRLVLVLVDGLRPDDAPLLPALDFVSQRGANLRLSVGAPGYGAPGLATLLTGAEPQLHGILVGSDTAALTADNLLAVAARAQITAGGTGSPSTGILLRAAAVQWQAADSLAQFREQAGPLLAPGGPRLAILQIGHLNREAWRLGTADRRDPFYLLAISQVDAELVRLLELVDWKTTAVVVAGINPQDSSGNPLPEGQIPLIMAGAGVKEGHRGQGRLIDLAPTLSTLIGAPVPVANQGRPLLEALTVSEGRPTDVVMQQVMASRAAYTRAALQALGDTGEVPEPPAEAAQADSYAAGLDQQIRTAGFAAWKARLLQVAPYAGGVLLVVLLYLVLVWRAKFGLPVFLGSLLYGALFQAVFFLGGGRYSGALKGLDTPGGPLRAIGLNVALALIPTLLLLGHLLARKGFKKRSYVGGAAGHFLLGTAFLVSLPVAVAIALTGWNFQVVLPTPGMQAWFVVTCIQVMVIGYLSPVWVILTIIASSLSRRLWPIKEVGDPERNAENVVRLKALRRSGKR